MTIEYVTLAMQVFILCVLGVSLRRAINNDRSAKVTMGIITDAIMTQAKTITDLISRLHAAERRIRELEARSTE